jgi:hypothetical protein
MNLISVSRSIESLHCAVALSNKNFIDGKYYVIYKEASAIYADLLRKSGIVPVNERELSSHVSYHEIQGLLREELRHKAGWYFQQFLQIAAALFLPCGDDLILCGADMMLTKHYRHSDMAGRKFINRIPHGHRNWNITHEMLGARADDDVVCYVAEHVVTEKAILEYIVRLQECRAGDLDSSFKDFVRAVVGAINLSYDVITNMYHRRNIYSIEPIMVEDIFSEYQYISLMSIKNFSEKFTIRNISHVRLYPSDQLSIDWRHSDNYEIVVFEG